MRSLDALFLHTFHRPRHGGPATRAHGISRLPANQTTHSRGTNLSAGAPAAAADDDDAGAVPVRFSAGDARAH